MKVLRADFAGACYGVQRALDIAYEVANAGKAYSLGPLIHNPSVVAELEQRGIEVVNDVPERFDETIVVRSHGIGPAVWRKLTLSGAKVADATCPYVTRAQKAASKLATEIGAVVVVGDPVHPEVDAIRAYAQEAGAVIWVVPDTGSIPDSLPETVGVVVQTTQNRRVFEQILAALRQRGIHAVVKDTICEATAQRQDAARALAARVDAMVVLGGKNSSNTTRLYEICKAICPMTYHVESIGELDPAVFGSCSTVGVTAGASTPESQIVPLIEYLEGL